MPETLTSPTPVMETPTPTPEPVATATATPTEPTPMFDLRNPGPLTPPTAEPVANATENAESNGQPEPTPETGETTEPAEPEPIPTYKVTVPLPNGTGENGTTNAGLLDIEFPSQEAADTVRFHLKQSARAAKLDQAVARYQGDAATVEFLTNNPVEGMLWMGQQNPAAADQFLAAQVQANPAKVATILEGLGFDISVDPYKAEVLDAKAELARRDMADKVSQGQQKFQGTIAIERFRGQAEEVVGELTAAAGLQQGTEDYEVFAERASRRLAALYQEKRGQVSQADMVASLQPVIGALTGRPATTATVHHSTAQPRNEAGQFTAEQRAEQERVKAQQAATALQQKNDRFRRLAGPTATVPVSAITKMPASASLYDLKRIGR